MVALADLRGSAGPPTTNFRSHTASSACMYLHPSTKQASESEGPVDRGWGPDGARRVELTAVLHYFALSPPYRTCLGFTSARN
jgi:hypothetical protein